MAGEAVEKGLEKGAEAANDVVETGQKVFENTKTTFSDNAVCFSPLIQ